MCTKVVRGKSSAFIAGWPFDHTSSKTHNEKIVNMHNLPNFVLAFSGIILYD